MEQLDISIVYTQGAKVIISSSNEHNTLQCPMFHQSL